MVTTAPARPSSAASLPGGSAVSLAFNWRRSELLWPESDPPGCGLDAAAARLVRFHLTLAAEEMLKAWRETGAPLPPPVSLEEVRQPRFDPLRVYWGRPEVDLRALLEAEVQVTLALARRPLGGQAGGRWAEALAEQCQRLGALSQARARQVGRRQALAELARALERLSAPASHPLP